MSLLQKYLQMEDEFNQKYTALVEERNELYRQLQEAQRAYNEALEKDVLDGSKVTKTALEKAHQAVKDKQHALNDNEAKNDVLQRIKDERLKALFPSVEAEFGQELSNTCEAILVYSNEMKELRARVILKAKHMNNRGQGARDKYYIIQQIANRIGTKLTVRFELPAVPLTSTVQGISQPLMPLEREVNDAYRNGTLDPWVQWYELTREIVHDEEARKKLQERQKKQEQQKKGENN